MCSVSYASQGWEEGDNSHRSHPFALRLPQRRKENPRSAFVLLLSFWEPNPKSKGAESEQEGLGKEREWSGQLICLEAEREEFTVHF